MNPINVKKNISSKIILFNDKNAFVLIPQGTPYPKDNHNKNMIKLYRKNLTTNGYNMFGIQLRDHYSQIKDSCKINDKNIATVSEDNYIRIFPVLEHVKSNPVNGGVSGGGGGGVGGGGGGGGAGSEEPVKKLPETFINLTKFSTKCAVDENITKIFLLSENELVSISDKNIKIWNINPAIKNDRDPIINISITTGNITTGCRINDTTFAVGVNINIYIYNNKGEIQKKLTKHTEIINDIRLINSNEIASGSRNGELCVWNTTTGDLIGFHNIGGTITTICELFDDLIACGLDNGEIKIYNKSNKTIIGSVTSIGSAKPRSERINDIEFLESDATIISITDDYDDDLLNGIYNFEFILEYLISKGDYETAFLASCKYNNTFIPRLLDTVPDLELRGGRNIIRGGSGGGEGPVEHIRQLFIDCYDNEGLNGLMWMVKQKNIDQIRVMLKKGIYINAVDINGNTALHHAVQIPDNEEIIRLLCNHREINVDILNDKLHTASHYIPKLLIDPLTGRPSEHPYESIIGSKTRSNTEDIKQKYYNSDWKGVTIEQMKIWFDNPLLETEDKEATNVNVFKNPLITGICLSCFTTNERDGACNHVRCECRTNLKLSGFWNGAGGIIPWLNEEIIRPQFSITEFCVACNTMCANIGWPHELPISQNSHEAYACSSVPIKRMDTYSNNTRNLKWYVNPTKPRPAVEMFPEANKLGLLRSMLGIKYYRIRKMIDKIIELQPRPGNAPITFSNAMKQISDAGIYIDSADILINHEAEFNTIIDDIMATKTFIPRDINLDLFPYKNIEDLYSLAPEDIIVSYPKLRHPRDVIENNLMPSLVDDAKQEDTLMGEVSDETIKFRHRNFRTLEIIEHNFTDINATINLFKTITNNNSNKNFGKCIVNNYPVELGGDDLYIEDSYLYPDELKIFIQRGYTSGSPNKIDIGDYITYRTNFITSDKIKYYISKSDIPKIRKMFIMDESSYKFSPESACGADAGPGVPAEGGGGQPDALAVGGGGQYGGYFKKYQKYLQKYLRN
jgi:hypothetical protein